MLSPRTAEVAAVVDMAVAAVDMSRLDNETVHTSRSDTTDTSGTAVGGITALARAGYGRTITASTCGPAIKSKPRRTHSTKVSIRPITTTKPKPPRASATLRRAMVPVVTPTSATIHTLD